MFFKREVLLTRERSVYERVCGILTENEIPFSVRTNAGINRGRQHGVPFIRTEAAYEYRILVPAKDYQRAMKLIR